jgi:hypothetical protein
MAIELELPAVYLDALVLDPTPARPAVINRDPEPGDVQVPIGAVIAFDITDVGVDGIDAGATQVFLNGERGAADDRLAQCRRRHPAMTVRRDPKVRRRRAVGA